MGGLAVNKAALQAKVDEIEGEMNDETLKETAYTPATWAALQNELSEAQAVLGNPSATQAEVDAALAELAEAKIGLEPSGRLTEEGFDFVNGVTPIDVDFDPAVQDGYEAVVPNDVASIGMSPVAENTEATVVVVTLNGQVIEDAADWSDLPLQEGVNTIKVGIYNKNVPPTLLSEYTATIIRESSKLGNLVPSVGTLSPSFLSDRTEYSVQVGSGVSGIQLTPTVVDPGSTIQITVNGGEPIEVNSGVISEELRLRTGSNAIVVTVTDRSGTTTEYAVTVIRASDSSDNNGSGGSSAPSNGSSGPSKETIVIDVVIGGDNEADITKVEIDRTTNADGNIKDQVRLTPEKAKETVEKAKAAGQNLARIVIPDPEDEVSQVTVDVPIESTKLLLENGIDLEIYNANAIIRIPNSSLEGIEGDFYFHLVPVKDTGERKQIEEETPTEAVVREVAGDETAKVVARPMTIETNLTSRPVILTLPLKDVKLPSNEAERSAYLAQLAIFILHSDGEKEVVKGDVVTQADGKLGLQFSINKFSTFTIIHLGGEADIHKAYINGFPDGEFKPNENVTRAQTALMIARNLGYQDGERVSETPFPDVPSDHYAAGAIAFVKAAGIMGGDPNGDFRPNDPVTRAEMTQLAANYLGLAVEEGDTVSFTDTVGHWAQGVIEAVHAAGTVQGYEDGSFNPRGNTSRAEAVVIINKLFKRGPLNGVSMPNFPDVPRSHWAFKDIEEAALDHAFLIDENQQEQIVK